MLKRNKEVSELMEGRSLDSINDMPKENLLLFEIKNWIVTEKEEEPLEGNDVVTTETKVTKLKVPEIMANEAKIFVDAMYECDIDLLDLEAKEVEIFEKN